MAWNTDGKEPSFWYTLTILNHEVEKLHMLDKTSLQRQIDEIKYVIEILNQGQGYLTGWPNPIKIKFFSEENF